MTNWKKILAARATRRAGKRATQAGVTLVEVLIVVAIMALLASGVGFFAVPKYKQAQIDTALQSARGLRTAIQDWQRLNNETICPTMSQLVEGKQVDSAAVTSDPWAQEWIFACTDDEVFVQSAGPDKKSGTADDLSIPKVAAETER
jgi:general secretion pathway protein G